MAMGSLASAREAARQVSKGRFHVSRTGSADNYDYERTEVRADEEHLADAHRCLSPRPRGRRGRCAPRRPVKAREGSLARSRASSSCSAKVTGHNVAMACGSKSPWSARGSGRFDLTLLKRKQGWQPQLLKSSIANEVVVLDVRRPDAAL